MRHSGRNGVHRPNNHGSRPKSNVQGSTRRVVERMETRENETSHAVDRTELPIAPRSL